MEFLYKRHEDPFPNTPHKPSNIQDILGKWLEVESAIIFLEGMDMAMNELMIPGHMPEHCGYVNLLMVVSGWPYSRCYYEDFWEKYLHGIVHNEMPVPESLEFFKRDLANRYVKERRANIAPIWSDNAILIIKNQLETLTPREERVLYLRFGLDGKEPHTLEKIGLKLGVIRERVRQIEAKALRKLRHPSRSEYLRLLLFNTPINYDSCNFIVKKIKENSLDWIIDSGDTEKLFQILLMPMSRFEFSARTTNCLRNAQITCVGDLIQKDEKELMVSNFFGRKSINEIKEVLKEANLRLGIQLNSELKKDFEVKRKD